MIEIMNPDSNKAYGHDMIIICMLKLRGDSISQPLEIIFKRLYEMVIPTIKEKKQMFSLFWRKAIYKLSKTVVQFHFYLSAGKYLNACFMTISLIFF